MQQNTNKTWIYVFVRTDLPLQQIIVQSNHAAYESGLKFDNPSDEPSSLIVISVRNKEQLLKAYESLSMTEIEFVQFLEPDWDYGLTAFASAPVTFEQRQIFKKYQLFNTENYIQKYHSENSNAI